MPRIAARSEDMATDYAEVLKGTDRELVPGAILCERSPERQAMRPFSSKFVVRPHEQDPIRLYGKGFRPIVSGDGGTDLDGRPLFIAAAAKFPDRADEFMAEVARIDASRAQALVDAKRPPPTPEELETKRVQLLSDGVAAGMARSQDREAIKAEVKAELEAEMKADAEATEAPVKRGPGRPKKTD